MSAKLRQIIENIVDMKLKNKRLIKESGTARFRIGNVEVTCTFVDRSRIENLVGELEMEFKTGFDLVLKSCDFFDGPNGDDIIGLYTVTGLDNASIPDIKIEIGETMRDVGLNVLGIKYVRNDTLQARFK